MFSFQRRGGINLHGSGSVSKANKRKRSSKREEVRSGNCAKVLTCLPELLELTRGGNLVGELNKRTCAQLKDMCAESGILRTGRLTIQ